MKPVFFTSLILIIGFSSCKKESGITKTINYTCIDTLTTDRYYPNDIIPPQFSGLYGTWKLTHVTGGFAGGEHDLIFDYLIFKRNGIYCVVDNDTVKEFGKVIVIEQNKEWVLIEMQPDSLSQHFVGDFEKQVDLSHNDTLLLYAPCCDRFNFELIKHQ